jgi:flagellum-specific ATP synthase
VLDRKIAERGFYPAIDVSRSISRVATDVIDADHKLAARKFRDVLATYDEVKDLLRIGMYQKGMNAKTDKAVELMAEVERFLKQDVGERSGYDITRGRLLQLAAKWGY